MVPKTRACSHSLFRAASHATRAAALFLVSSFLFQTASAQTDGAPDCAQRLRDVLLGTPGQRILCPACPDEPAVRVDTASGQSTEVPLPYERVNDLTPFPGGERILAATSSEKGKRSQLLVLSSESLAPLGRVEISGDGERVIVSPDGYLAYVISRQKGHSGEGEEDGEWELLAVDLGKNRTVASYPLPGAAYDLAITPGGERVFLGLDGKIQSFLTAPLTASWFFRSPGKNRRLMLRPRQGQIFALRDSELAVFPPEPQKPKAGETGAGNDDAQRVLNPPVHLSRLGFSADGRFAVGAGRAMDVLVIIDAVRAKITGTWPEDSAAVATLLVEADAAEQPRGPRGKLVAQGTGFAPPLGAPARPGTTETVPPSTAKPPTGIGGAVEKTPAPPALGGIAQASPPGMAPGTEPAQGGWPAPPMKTPAPSGAAEAVPPSTAKPPTGIGGAVEKAPASAALGGNAQASPPGMAAPDPAPAQVSEKPLGVPPPRPLREITPEVASLEEVTGDLLHGKISGDFSRVVWVVLYGPDSLTSLRDRVAPAPDGTFSFTLPPKGRYRILLAGKPGTTLVSRPPYQTLEVGQYGFVGIDFKIVGAWGSASP